jgi:ligand-binding sensor domain-containing protein
LFQDSKGYIWIGTIDGLQRYDGNRFVNYLPDIHDPKALHNGLINAIFEDSKHRFWVGTSTGAPYLLNRSTGAFYNYGLHVLNAHHLIDGVGKFIETSNGDIWVMNQSGYYRLNNNTNQFENLNALAGVTKDVWAEHLDQDSSGNIWFVTHAGIRCYNIKSKKSYDKNNNPQHLKIFDLKPDFTAFLISGNNFWIGIPNRTALIKYDISKNIVSEYSLENTDLNNNYTAFFAAKTYQLTGSTDGSVMVDLLAHGIAFYDPFKDRFTEIPIKNEAPTGLHGPIAMEWSITTLKDRDGNRWVSGGDRGLNIFNPSKIKFTFYGTNTEKSQAVPGYPANGFIQDSAGGNIYVGYYYTSGGIVQFTDNLVAKKKYLFSKAGNNNLYENQVWCLYKTSDGNIWAPNQAGTILNLNTRNNKLSIINDTALYGNITTIEKDQKGDLWLGYWSEGLKKIDSHTHQVTSFAATIPGAPMQAKNILSIYFDGDRIIWVGTNNQGFFQFNKITGRYSNQYLLNESNMTSISGNVIYKIIKYNSDTLLLATNMGVNIFDKKKKSFSNISTKDGLPGNVVGTMEMDDNQNLWVGCQGGFCKINMHNLSITRYGMADGITDNTFSDASLKLKDGRFIFSTENGFIAFNPNDLKDAYPANPVITGFKVFDKPVIIDSLLDIAKPVVLSYQDNSLSFEFASLQYFFSDEIKYYYQLEGADKDWIAADKTQSAHYSQLQNGNYVFKVKTVNRDGIMSEKIAVLKIVITPPFWKTWWFRIGAFLLAIFIIYWYLQSRIGKIKAQENVKLQITELEIKALKAQMNPHFIFNAMNSIQEFTLMGEIDNANKYISKFSKLLRKVLHQSRQNSVLLSDEIETLQLYLEIEKVRLGKDFSYQISTDNDAEIQVISIPSMVLQPFVENALHHGLVNKEGDKHLLINFKITDDETLVCEITDNGIGREKAEALKTAIHPSLKQASLGIVLVAERLKLLSKPDDKKIVIHIDDIVSSNGVACGTKVTIVIPQI